MKCILCKSGALPGLKYCAPHYARAQKQTLAEKLAEQRAGVEIALPGFENVEGERAEVMAVEQGEALSAELLKPKANIDAKAGALECNSPLFRGHGPQGELF